MSSPTSLVEDQRPMTGSEKEPQTGKKAEKPLLQAPQEVGYL